MRNLEREKPQEIETSFKGVLHFYSETGTEGAIWAFQDEKFMTSELWDGRGLHFLHNGDNLKILDKEDRETVLWQGTIDLTEPTNFEEDVFGYWIHNTQKGTNKEQWGNWFINENPAQLELGDEAIKILKKIKAKERTKSSKVS